MLRGHLVRNIMPVMALKAHGVYLVTLENNVRLRGADIFVVGVACAQAVTAGTGDLCPKMSLTYLFLDKWNMAYITGGISAHGIALFELS
jgi:hypothetical protein